MKKNKQSSSSFDDKWPPEVAKEGFTQVPNYLLNHQGELGINSSQLNLLLQLMQYDYGTRKVWPAHSTITKKTKLKDSAIRQNIVVLETKGFIKRNFNSGVSNTYDLRPSIDKLRNHSRQHPIKKTRGAYQKTDRPPPQKFDTKEYFPKRLNKKMEHLNDILVRKNITK